ncbi:MAG: restriction endonuclease subunit S [Sphaerochaetaceae bacterium]
MNNIKPYTKYKPTGIAWLGDIPEQWEVKKVKHLFTVQRGRVIPNTDLVDNGIYPVYSSQTKNKGKLGCINTYDYDGEYISWTTDGVYAGTTFVRKGKFNATNICGLLKLRVENKIDFFGHLFSHIIPYNKRPDTNGAKIMSNEMKDIHFVIPSLPEQTVIASFLDYKTAKIDRFIRKKKQLIKLLNEQKAGIINDAVTKGIGALSGAETPNAKMKPSGIEWLGDIPEHWEVRKLKYSVCLNRHKTFENKESVKNKIALENIESKTGRILDSSENAFEGLGTIFRNGDVLFGKLRPYLAKVVSPIFEGSCVNEILVLTPNDKVWDTEFLKFRMLSSEFIRIVNDSTFGSKMPRASWGFIGGLKISCPPLSEQTAIVSHIEKETATINTTIATIEKEIALVQEYRTALIAEAVTGKIDVRGYAFPNVVEEETYEELEEELDIAAEDEAEYQKQETE